MVSRARYPNDLALRVLDPLYYVLFFLFIFICFSNFFFLLTLLLLLSQTGPGGLDDLTSHVKPWKEIETEERFIFQHIDERGNSTKGGLGRGGETETWWVRDGVVSRTTRPRMTTRPRRMICYFFFFPCQGRRLSLREISEGILRWERECVWERKGGREVKDGKRRDGYTQGRTADGWPIFFCCL